MATHPYVPEDLEIPGYKAIDMEYSTILGVFFIGSAVVVAALLSVARKEYAKADVRYITRDACTIGIEGITVFIEGPLCLLCIWGYVRKASWRHILTALIVTGELYGTVLYFYTSYHDEFMHNRKEPLFWWFYFWFMNSIWVVCPSLVIINLCKRISSAIHQADTVAVKKQM